MNSESSFSAFILALYPLIRTLPITVTLLDWIGEIQRGLGRISQSDRKYLVDAWGKSDISAFEKYRKGKSFPLLVRKSSTGKSGFYRNTWEILLDVVELQNKKLRDYIYQSPINEKLWNMYLHTYFFTQLGPRGDLEPNSISTFLHISETQTCPKQMKKLKTCFTKSGENPSEWVPLNRPNLIMKHSCMVEEKDAIRCILRKPNNIIQPK